MKKLLVSLAVLACLAVPAAANASPCRNAKGQFAKCGTPGAMAPGMKMGAAAPAAPAAEPAKAGPCKDAKGKFVKCGAAPAMAPAAKPSAAPAMAPAAKKGPCKDAKGKFVKC